MSTHQYQMRNLYKTWMYLEHSVHFFSRKHHFLFLIPHLSVNICVFNFIMWDHKHQQHRFSVSCWNVSAQCSDLHFHILQDMYVYIITGKLKLKIVSYTTSTYIQYIHILSSDHIINWQFRILLTLPLIHRARTHCKIVRLALISILWRVDGIQSHCVRCQEINRDREKRESVILCWLKWHVFCFFLNENHRAWIYMQLHSSESNIYLNYRNFKWNKN